MRAWKELSRLPRRLWILAAATLVNRMGTMALPFLALYLVRELGLTPSQAGALMALYGAVAFFAGPLGGRLADRLGNLRVMKWSLALSGLVMLAYPHARSLAEVAVMTALWAAIGEAFRPANMAAVAEAAPPEQAKAAYALHRVAINVGMSLGPALGGFLAEASFPWIWRVDGLTNLAAVAVLAACLPPAKPATTEHAGSPSAAGLKDARLLWFLLASIPVGVVFFQHEGPLSLYLVRDLGFKESFFGLLFTVNTLLIVALEVPLNHATAHWPHRRSLAAGAALFALGFGAYGLTTTAWQIVAATVVWTFGEMILMPAMSAYVSDIAPAARRGEYMGLYMMAFSVAFMLGPWAGLRALDRWGPGALWTGVLACGLASTAAFRLLKEPRPRASS